MLALLSALGIDPNADPDDQIEEACELAEAARRLPRVYAERDEALQALRRLDDEAAKLQSELKELTDALEFERRDRAAVECYLHGQVPRDVDAEGRALRGLLQSSLQMEEAR